MIHNYYSQDDVRAIINGTFVKRNPIPPEPNDKWKLAVAVILWIATFGLTVRWALYK